MNHSLNLSKTNRMMPYRNESTNGRFFFCLLAAFAIFAVHPVPAATQAMLNKDGKWIPQTCAEIEDIKNFKPAETVKLSKYGGWTNRRVKATGYFHATQIKDRWWLVDPDGYLFLSVGMNSVNQGHGDASKNREDDDLPAGIPSSARTKWAEQALALLREKGFNTLGCWSETVATRKLDHPMPYCLRWGFMGTYARTRKARYPETGKIEAIYPFDPEFESFCVKHAEGLAETKNDPFLLGHFSDNELSLHESGIVKRYLSHPQNDPCHKAAAQFMASHQGGRPADNDRDFLRLVVSEYYRKVSAAIRLHDPNHMFLGSRFHGIALKSPSLFAGAGPYADVISVNYYNRWTPENDRIRSWSKLAGKPILITEWYALAPPAKPNAGFLVKTQEDRARFYQNFTLKLLDNPACVGWHWFNYRTGVVDEKEAPFAVLLSAMKRLNDQVYPLAELLKGNQ